MFAIDYWIIWIPLLFVIFAAFKTQRYVKGVADFLTAGRVAGRYVVSVASGEAAMGLISAVAIMEMYYKGGFAFSFWGQLTLPISMVLGLVGFCTYRFRETKCMTMGQFFEIRYSKSFRVFAAILQSVSGIVNYAIFPAVGGRFLVYFLDLPHYISIGSLEISTFGLVMFIFLGIALLIATLGGQVTIMVTDCVQGLLSYPMYALVVGYIFYRFSWSEEIVPTMLARAPGESFLNPYDIDSLRDFNLFYVMIGIVSVFLSRMSWGGTSGYNGAAKSPHEAKMGGLLGTWRSGFSSMIFVLLAVVALTYINHKDFSKESRMTRTYLANKTIDDVLPGQENAAKRAELKKIYENIPERTKFSTSYKSKAEYLAENSDPYIKATKDVLGGKAETAKNAQTFETIYTQMLVSVSIRDILPAGLTGIFCALMIFLMISTDTTYMHSWGTILVQDFVLPLQKNGLEPAKHLKYLRWAISGVCLFAFLFSLFFAQVDYILMFFAITGAIWAGAGIVITLGLYWKRGTTAGAFAALIAGAFIAVSGILAQTYWASHIYPALAEAGLVESADKLFRSLSAPFEPYIQWRINPQKFPINSAEIGFAATLSSIILYVTISLLTCRKPFNMDRMFHRGIYSEGETKTVREKVSLKSFLQRNLLGIDENYTRGDKVLAWSCFIYSFGYSFLTLFVGVIIWNSFSPWPMQWWADFFFFKSLLVAGIIAIISTFWFGICGTRDLFRLFRDLAEKEENVLDDGRVIGHVSAADQARIEKIDSVNKLNGSDEDS